MKEIVLQNLMVPKIGLCTEQELYFRLNDKGDYDFQEKLVKLEQGGCVNFNTFFNSFSIEKWKRYTKLTDLNLKVQFIGSIEIKIYNALFIDGKVVKKCIGSKQYSLMELGWVTIPINDDFNKGIISFSIFAKDESVIKNVEYTTESNQGLEPFSIALNMCTYKKEKYIYKNLEILKKEIIENPNSELYRHIYIYITDNACTIDDAVENENISLTKQNAYGSVGGFTRGLINILNAKEEKNIKYVVMMDDDISFDSELFFRTYRFLQFLENKYRNAWLGASMLRMDFQRIQHEKGGNYNDDAYVSLKHGYDLCHEGAVIRNEIEENEKVNAWWYVAIPLSSISESKLPYPVYFHCDDIEFALRNCETLITLNGISVWHDGFEHKYDNFYFDIRNKEIVLALHRPFQATKKKAMMRIARAVLGSVFRFKYYEAEQMIDGMNDFLGGPEYIQNLDNRKRFNDVIKHYKERLIKVNEFGSAINYEEYLSSAEWKNETKFKTFLRRISLNGWCLPSKYTITVSATMPCFKQRYFRVKTAVNYDEIANAVYLEHKSYSQFLKIFIHLLKIEIKIFFRYKSSCKEYNQTLLKYTNIDNWCHIYESK